MSNRSQSFSLLFFFVYLIHVVVATPLRAVEHGYWGAGTNDISNPVQNMEQRVMLGYNGFSGNPRPDPPQPSKGGELGAVFYVADAVDLAKLFANGADPTKNYICRVTADAVKWQAQNKVWVPPEIIRQGAAAVNRYSPGYVIFAPHAHPNPDAVPPLPAHVYQMGIRQDQIIRLNVKTECLRKSAYDNSHQTMDYYNLNTTWNIQTPPRPAAITDIPAIIQAVWSLFNW